MASLGHIPSSRTIFLGVGPKEANADSKIYVAGAPLMQTLLKSNFELSEYLLNHGADANAICGPDKRQGRYLRLAAEKLPLQYTTLLLEHGAQIAQTGAIGMAAQKGRLDVLKVLIENGGDVNERLQPDAGFFTQKTRFQKASETPLYVATEHGQRDVVVWLLEQGADAEIGDLSGKTPRELAREMGNEELVNVLEGNVDRGI